MDRDMVTLNPLFGVQETLMQAFSLTQSDHTARLTSFEDRLGKVDGKLDLVHVGVEAIHTMLKVPLQMNTMTTTSPPTRSRPGRVTVIP